MRSSPKKNSFKEPKNPSQNKLNLKPSFPIVAIGASAGGLKALSEFFRYLPVDTGMAFVVVQHLSPAHESMMADILSRTTKIPVSEIRDGMPVAPDHIYVMPEKACISLSGGILRAHSDLENQHMRMPIDYFFHSVAEDWGNKTIGVIFSGSASDGSLGLIAIKEAGGITFAQDQASAEFSSMPQSAISTGCVDFVCSPKETAVKIIAIRRHPYSNDSLDETAEASLPADDPFRQILKLLRQKTNINFENYKSPTIRRRVVRRMVLNKLESLTEYVGLLKKSDQEIKALSEDALIHVTQFFRDPEMFEFFKRNVFPALIEKTEPGTPLRIWVAACATGEEAYSMAIALMEFLGDKANDFPIQIFATDAKETCIATARKGIYKKGPAFNLSEERLRRFFLKVGDGYQILKSIRDVCVFAKQNALTDPPYSKMDLVSCRNLLIYLDAAGQGKLLQTFHYALKPSRFLALGKSESAGARADLFDSLDKKIKIYSKKTTGVKNTLNFTPSDVTVEKFPVWKPKASEAPGQDIFKVADRAILAKYEQAGVIVNENMEILQFRGDTSPFLNNSPGTPSTELFKMVREGLGADLHIAVAKAKKEGQAVQKKGSRIKYQDKLKEVFFEVIPLMVVAGTPCFLILFSMLPPGPGFAGEPAASKGKKVKKTGGNAQALRNRELEEELAAMKTYLRAIIEDREAVNLKLQAINEDSQATSEEFQSMNEELQSANEELETAQEELQATNEEITTVNDELQNRISQLTVLNDDLSNLLASIHLPVIMVGKDLHVRRFTRAAGKVFHLIPADIGRPLTDLKLRINLPDFEAIISEVISTASAKEQEVQDDSGKWYFVQMRPYKTSDNKIDGAIIMVADIDGLKKNQELLEIQQAKLEMSNQELEQFAYVASHDLQEPLRMISMYLDLLRKRYKDKLDKDAEEFMGFAKESAERSEKMVRDLLEYARIGSKAKSPKLTNFETILKRTLSNLEIAVLESGAGIWEARSITILTAKIY